MPDDKLSWCRGIALALVLSCLGLAQQSAQEPGAVSLPSSDETALRALVDQYFAAYAGKDLEAYLRLWSERSPNFTSRRQIMTQLFTGAEHSFSGLRVSRLNIAGEQATLRVQVDRFTLRAGLRTITKMALDLACVKEGGEWKVWSESSAVGNLANALLAAKTEAERQALLAEEPELVTRELYDWLLRPAQEQLAGRAQLAIVPDGLLWNLPFPALQPNEEQVLLETHALSVAPSLTALRALSRFRGQQRSRAVNAALLAFGNPTLGQKELERMKAARLQETISPLPEAEKEAAALAKLYGAGQSQVYLGAEAREDRAKAEAGKYGALHWAAHATLNEASPLFSHVALSPAENGVKEDGLLEAREILQWELKAEVAVLSASEQAPPRLGSGRALTGLVWAWFVAGCPVVIASRWRGEAPGTTGLMLDFHRQLKAHPRGAAPKAKVWQAAALKLRQSDESRHPFHWAGFTVLGDGW
jgi:CHAT domain-containing protein